ncbi:interleukin-13 receptor subunit alpha-1 isoform X2 [Dunckerocampus dactyliophorus]|uniref:interleukin-13 receptor subunit alpha-1 isoform X2 n=1 Tax=Dunckerocampus dactyliophorus TaxID=161453 RepID=UPI0024076D22|nr:interleukin-13 receptor subunit alpha-1 isoform X2 [Dunckerocampus dactyliophorus]
MLFFHVLLSLLLAAGSPSQTVKITPPHNLTLQWTSDFDAQLWWAHERLPPSCKYKVSWRTKEKYSMEESDHQTPPSLLSFSMEGGSLFVSVHSVCKDQHSQPAVLNVTYPELVSDVQCGIISSTLTQCSWRPLSPPPSLSFYYGLVDELEDMASFDVKLRECPLYTHTDSLRTGCHLRSTAIQSIYVLFNTTLNDTLVRNTFKIKPVPVTPRPLNWSISEVGGKFILSWVPPDVLHLSRWTFIINYTECDERKIIEVLGKTSKLIHRVSHCCYHMSLKARSLDGETGWSDAKYFAAAKDANARLYAAIIIPLLLVGLTLLTCVCCSRNKEHIFTKVPQPRDLLSDIYNNKTKSAVCNLHFPEKEEENCKITLVTDQQQEQFHHFI